MQNVFSIAIDGPSGAGKSSVARAVAEKLDAMYLDTGAMYRAVGLYMLKNGVPLNDPAAIAAHCPGVDVRVGYGRDGRQCVYLGEEDVSEAIRAAEVSLAASSVSTVPEVRERMVALQRRIASGHSVVMDGRDIGTKVLPDATLKVFLTASAEVRALGGGATMNFPARACTSRTKRCSKSSSAATRSIPTARPRPCARRKTRWRSIAHR